MTARTHWCFLAATFLQLGFPSISEGAGITAVTRRTVMGGVPGATPAQAASGNNGAIIYSPQPAAAAAMLLPGRTPLASGATPMARGAGASGRIPATAGPVAYQPTYGRPAAGAVAVAGARITPSRATGVAAVKAVPGTSSVMAPAAAK